MKGNKSKNKLDKMELLQLKLIPKLVKATKQDLKVMQIQCRW